jgi:hypothetical protein
MLMAMPWLASRLVNAAQAGPRRDTHANEKAPDDARAFLSMN